MSTNMKTDLYEAADARQVFALWNTSGVKQGYVPFDFPQFEKTLILHPYFNRKHAFVLKDENKICGFVCGCEGDALPFGKERGYFTCLLLDDPHDNREATELLLAALENSFREAGKSCLVSNCFNPMKLPWFLPGTPKHQHNNAPGIAVDTPLFERMAGYGYQDRNRECAMYLDLDSFEGIPQRVVQLEEKAASEGYSVAWYDSRKHTGLQEMTEATGNPMWIEEIPYAAEHINMLVALKENRVAGFTGPVYPEESGRGYFAGIAVSPLHEKHGLGTLLFYRLCKEEKEAGSKYMSLFTGIDNHARRIYQDAGFTGKRVFSVMLKEI